MKQRAILNLTLASTVLALSTCLAACQEVDQPKTTLTQKQWQEVKRHIDPKQVDPEYPIGAKFGDKIELIGFDVSKPLVAGKPSTFTWYWKALDDIDDNWKVFVHFDSSKKAYRQNLDHHPLDGLYQTSRWKKGQVIEDVQKVTLNGNYPAGQAVPYIGFYKGNQRLPIKNGVKKTDDRRVIGPPLTIKNPNDKGRAAKELPTYSPAEVDQAALEKAKVDGKLDEDFWKKAKPISLEPFGAAPDLHTKVYVLRGKDHLLVGARMPDERVWSKLDKRDADTWTEEVFEMYIDKDRDGKDYLEMQINPLGTVFDAHFAQRLGRGKGSRDEQIDRARAWNMKGLESAVYVEGTVNDDSDKDTAWSVELKIPYTSIPGIDQAPKDGESWAVDFYRYDRPDDKRTYAYAWSKPNGGSFHQVERFGTLQFGKADAKSAKTQAKTEAKNKKGSIKRIPPAQLQNIQRKLKLRQIKPARFQRVDPSKGDKAEK